MSGFIWYMSVRLASSLVTILIGCFAIFILMQLAPGDPAIAVLGEAASTEAIAFFRKEHGLDDPMLVQFWRWASGMLQGNFGMSISVALGFPINELIAQRLPQTIFLGLYGALIAVSLSLAAGTIAALRQGKMADTVATSLAVLGISMPEFWLSFMLILIFALWLPWFPAFGFVQPDESLRGAIYTGFLPALAIGAPLAGVYTRILRSALLETKRRDYVTAARSFGFKERFIFAQYIFRNAIIPYVTVVGLQIRYLLGGTVLIERIFGIQGIGSMFVDGVFARDFQVVQACMVIFLVGVLAVNLIVDLICGALDPRRTR